MTPLSPDDAPVISYRRDNEPLTEREAREYLVRTRGRTHGIRILASAGELKPYCRHFHVQVGVSQGKPCSIWVYPWVLDADEAEIVEILLVTARLLARRVDLERAALTMAGAATKGLVP